MLMMHLTFKGQIKLARAIIEAALESLQAEMEGLDQGPSSVVDAIAGTQSQVSYILLKIGYDDAEPDDEDEIQYGKYKNCLTGNFTKKELAVLKSKKEQDGPKDIRAIVHYGRQAWNSLSEAYHLWDTTEGEDLVAEGSIEDFGCAVVSKLQHPLEKAMKSFDDLLFCLEIGTDRVENVQSVWAAKVPGGGNMWLNMIYGAMEPMFDDRGIEFETRKALEDFIKLIRGKVPEKVMPADAAFEIVQRIVPKR